MEREDGGGSATTSAEGGDGEDDGGLSPIGRIMHAAIAERVFPCGVVAFGRKRPDGGFERWLECFGTQTFESNVPAQEDSVFDVASLTKVVVTATALLLLEERGLVDLDDRVCDHLPGFGANGKDGVTVRQLLTHSAGFRAWYNFRGMGLRSKEAIVDFVLGDAVLYAPGTDCVYSDLSMIALGALVERLSGMPLDRFATQFVFEPLGLKSTGFRPVGESCTGKEGPPAGDASAGDCGGGGGGPAEATKEAEVPPADLLRVIPTEVDGLVRERLVWGEVSSEISGRIGTAEQSQSLR